MKRGEWRNGLHPHLKPLWGKGMGPDMIVIVLCILFIIAVWA